MRRLFSFLAIAGASFALFECVGDDPDTSSPSPSPDAAASDGTTGGDGGTTPPDTDANVPTDAGVDGAAPLDCDAGAPVSAAGTFQCATDAGCATPGKCCLSNDLNGTRCYSAATNCAAFLFVCDKAADCPDAGARCCLAGATANTSGTCPFQLTGATGTSCTSACGSSSIELCTAQQTCADPQKKCVPVVATVQLTAESFTRVLGACL